MLLRKMSLDNEYACEESDRENGEYLEEKADNYMSTICGKFTAGKSMSEDIKKIRADFIAAQTVELVDPININQETKYWEDIINSFMI